MPDFTERSAQVAFVDFRGLMPRPESVDEFLQRVVETDKRFRAGSGSDGVIYPWNLLLVDTPEGVSTNSDFYDQLIQSVFDFRIIVVLVLKEDSGPEDFTLSVPDSLRANPVRLKVVVNSSQIGVLWHAGGLIPTGVVQWERDPDGELALEALVDVLREQSVFSGLFGHMVKRDEIAWAIGTRQVWMGRLSGALTQEAFLDVGQDVLGSGRLASRDFDPWPESDYIVGTASEEKILMDNGALGSAIRGVSDEISKWKNTFGLLSKKNRVERVADSPTKQQNLLSNIETKSKDLIPVLTQLVHDIDASNGFDRQELLVLREKGINLRAVHSHEAANESLENLFFEGVLRHTQTSIEDGHSIDVIWDAVSTSIKRITPRTQQEVIQAMDEARSNFERALDHARQASANPPSGLLFRLGRLVAKGLRRPLVRYVGFFLFLWALVAGVYEVIGDGSDAGPIPWPDFVRETLHLAALSLDVVLLAIVAIGGVLLVNADRKIQAWGRRHDTVGLDLAWSAVRLRLCDIAVNDWAFCELRTRVARQMDALKGVLEIISDNVEQNFVTPFRDVDPEELDEEIPNPKIREDLNARAEGQAFRYLAEVKKIVRLDLSIMISESLELTYALGSAVGRNVVPRRIEQMMRTSINRYVRDGRHFGLLYEHLSTSPQSLVLRRELAQKIWEEPRLVDNAMRSVVLMRSPVELVTFVEPNHLRYLMGDEDNSAEVRFCPTYASGRLEAVSAQIDYLPTGIIATEALSAAGVIRVTPFKPDVLTFT
jgi:hypothetical protein